MLISGGPRPTLSNDDLIGPALAAAIEKLDVMSRRSFAGKLPGERRSKARGQSVEFDDYRPYVPGDDLRFIDWNVYARLDRFVLKLFREDRDLSVHLMLDVSPSMLARSSAVLPTTNAPRQLQSTKLLHAARLAAALGYIGLVRNNRVSLTTFGGPSALRAVTPVRGRRGVERLFASIRAAVESASTSGPHDPDAVFHEACDSVTRHRAQRGVLVMLSDFLVPTAIDTGLHRLAVAASGFDVWLAQTLTPEELDPSSAADELTGDLAITDIERGRIVEVTISPATLNAYRERLEAHQQRLDTLARRWNLHRLLVRTDQPVQDLLFGLFRRRALIG